MRLYSIQYLRALAAIAVIIFHTGAFTFGYAGNAGVDVFFVISGFVMWTVSASRPQTPSEFILNRVFRIVPMYWLVTLLFVGTAVSVPSLFPRLVLDTTHTAASLFFVPMESPSNGKIWPVLVPGWTLNYEMFFYVLFASTLILPKKARLPILIGIFSCLTLTGIFYTSSNPLIITYTDSILLEFLAGVILGYAVEFDRLPSRTWGYTFLATGFSLFVLAASTEIASPRVLVWGIPALIVVAGAVTLELNGCMPIVTLAALIGDASYSIYLTHTLTISAILKLGIFFSPSARLAAGLCLSVLVGLAAWWLVERPMTQLIRQYAQGHGPSRTN